MSGKSGKLSPPVSTDINHMEFIHTELQQNKTLTTPFKRWGQGSFPNFKTK